MHKLITIWCRSIGFAACGALGYALPSLVFPSTSLAGTYQVIADGSALCALGQFESNVPGFITTCNAYGVSFNVPYGDATVGARQLFEIDAPSSALTITDALLQDPFEGLESGGYGGGTYWSGGGVSWKQGVPSNDSGAISSQYFGLQIVCGSSNPCEGTEDNDPGIAAAGVELTVAESQAPGLVAVGNSNLFYQTNNWVWNPAGDPWSVALTGSDPSGICAFSARAAGPVGTLQPTDVVAPNPAAFQQCPSGWTWYGTIDTNELAATSGQATLQVSDTDAANNNSSPSTTLNIDNVAPTVSASATNDPDPGGWSVNHSVTLELTPKTGPSGISSVTCTDSVNGASATPLPTNLDSGTSGDYDATVDGNGDHNVSCTVANNAVDPQGAHNTASTSEDVKIDEQNPSVSFDPINPGNPTQVVVQASDSESAVQTGSIEIAPTGSSSWTPLPTTFAAGQLTATIPDASLKAGGYTVQASATSQVGNTGLASENVTLPLRQAIQSAVGFNKVVDPLVKKRVKERVRVDWHYGAKLNKHGEPVRVKVGGHFVIKTVVKRVEECKIELFKVKHRLTRKTVCRAPHVVRESTRKVGFGKKASVTGVLTSTSGTAIPGQAVNILTAPTNGSKQFRVVASVMTDSSGAWSVKLPAGPSRVVRASYPGSATNLPASGRATVKVPARITIHISPLRLSWSGWITITGQLKGGYVPHDGVALRLLVRYPGSEAASPLLALRTNKKGRFRIRWTYHSGNGTLALPFWVATDSNESDYAYAASASRHIPVTFTG